MSSEPTALFRYRLIAEALSDRLTPAERGLLVRELASHTHELPDGTHKEFSRATLDRWIRAYRGLGLQGLLPQPRSDRGAVREHPDLIEEACRLRREAPQRSAKQISRILFARHQVRVPARTISAHLARRGLDRTRLAGQPRVYGRFEAERPNEIWIGDVLHGPFIPWPKTAGSRRAYLFMLLDDHSRLILNGRWVTQENTRAGQEVLREAIRARGLPDSCYFDNGGPYVSAPLERTYAVLGVRLIHSRPGQPAGARQGRAGFRFVREAFLAEATLSSIESFQQLNDRFIAWVDNECKTRLHAETKESPAARYAKLQSPRWADPELLHEAFRWSQVQVSLAGIKYQVDPTLCGRGVVLLFDPGDLSRIDVWYDQRPYGSAVPFVLGRHVGRQIPNPTPPPPTPTLSSPNYLEVVEREHLHRLGHLDYRQLEQEDHNP